MNCDHCSQAVSTTTEGLFIHVNTCMFSCDADPEIQDAGGKIIRVNGAWRIDADGNPAPSPAPAVAHPAITKKILDDRARRMFP